MLLSPYQIMLITFASLHPNCAKMAQQLTKSHFFEDRQT